MMEIEMMYNQKFVVAVKVGGQVLRENGDQVTLPWSSEYALFLKNLGGQRASVSVSIDGQDALGGHQLIVDAGRSIDLERFIADSLTEGRRFKFIERTTEIEQHRGIEAEDGLIRVSFRFEQQVPLWFNNVIPCGNSYHYPKGGTFRGMGHTDGGLGASINCSDTFGATAFLGSVSATACATNVIPDCATFASASCEVKTAAQLNDVGITVEGSKSSQQFHHGAIGVLEAQEHVIVLKLRGGTVSAPVAKPITVKTKKECSSCGRKFASTFEYCNKDGTFLHAV